VRAELLRGLLAALVLGLGLRLSFELIATPTELYSLTPVVIGQ